MGGLNKQNGKRLIFYSPYNFVRELSTAKQLQNFVYPAIDTFESKEHNSIVSIIVGRHEFRFYISFLPWDTAFFGITTYKLCYVLYASSQPETLREAVKLFMAKLFTERAYCFMDIPCEDTLLIQALTRNQFALTETRVNYFRNDLQSFNAPRYPVRKARPSDIETLKQVAREMRNEYDRFHADEAFTVEKADEFLAAYIEESIKGFADIVLTPADDTTPSHSFLTAKYLKNDWPLTGVPISKMVLSAVSSNTNKGWYKKLVSEMTRHLKSEGAQIIYMTTQATNRPVIHIWESLGYRFGSATHILTYKQP